MSHPRTRIFWITLAGVLSAVACGPYFPDTVLDLPQAALRVRSSCLLDEMIAIDRSHGRGLSLHPRGRAMLDESGMGEFDWQIPEKEWERKELKRAIAPVVAAGMPAELAEKTRFGDGQVRSESVDLACVLLGQGVAAARVGEIIDGFTSWRSSLPVSDFDGAWGIVIPAAAKLPTPPDFPEVPSDIRSYWSAACAFRGGDLPTARTAWQSILDLPESNNRQRAVWAAWMLAKTSRDLASALPFYRKTLELAEGGCYDALGLAPLARGWLALGETDPVAALKWYFEAACSGEDSMLTSLRQQVPKIIEADDEVMSRAVADPLVREIVTALLFSMRCGPDSSTGQPDPRMDAWLAQLEKQPSSRPSPAAAKAAWIRYSCGDFEGARRWLGMAPAGAGEVLWLRAKLALRDGKLDEAARLFAKAAPVYQFEEGKSPAEPRGDDLRWFEHGGRRDWMRGQFQTDRAIVHIGRGEFLRAMDFLVKASYHQDAAYLAERVLTTDELVAWIRKNRPSPPADPAKKVFLMNANGDVREPDGLWARDPLRYLLARRLAREFRFREAAEFMPAALSPLFDHYVRLHRAARSGAWPDETKGVILWNLAVLRRRLGMELFGYEGAPDNSRWDGSFEAIDYVGRRSRKTGWHFEWGDEVPGIKGPVDDSDRAIPVVSREEIQRLAKHRAGNEQRFHYRYDAAEIAWQAAKLLPDNHSGTLFVLHEAGRWLAHRDPRAADRFYQEILRRCVDLPQGRVLDERRWFLPQAPASTLPELPVELRFHQPNVAGVGGSPSHGES